MPATASAFTPYNFGNCIAYEAMFGEGTVADFIEYSSPMTVFEDENGDIARTVGPKYPDNVSVTCGVTP